MPLEASLIGADFAPGLARSEPVPQPAPGPNQATRGRGRPRKDAPAPGPGPAPEGAHKEKQAGGPAPAPEKKGIPWFREQETLSEKEAAALYEPLKAALSDYFDYADEYIWYRERHSDDTPIWGNADDEELSAVARVMLKRGKRSPMAATAVRGIVNGDDYITAAIFVVPRFVESQRRLRAAPKRERKAKR